VHIQARSVGFTLNQGPKVHDRAYCPTNGKDELVSELAKDLGAATAANEKAPSGWEPYSEEVGQIGSAIVKLPRPGMTEHDLLVSAGFDPDCWRITGPVQTRKWMNYSGDWLYYYRFATAQGESPESQDVHVDELAKVIRSRRKAPKPAAYDGKDAWVYVASDWQLGKALTDDTPVLTPDGWKSHGSIRPGDYVYGPDGLAKRVTDVTGSTEQDVYEVQFDHGVTITATANHLWEGWRRYKDSAGNYGRRRVTMTTAEIAALKPSLRDGREYQSRPFHVDLPSPIDNPEAQLPIDPYLLGAWLGDGNSRNGYITVGGSDVDHWLEYGYYIPYVTPTGNHTLQTGLSSDLREAGLIRNKHIPDLYMNAAASQRLALIQGLMDTDGYVSPQGVCEFTQVSTKIADGFCNLLTGLGMKFTRTMKKTTHKSAHKITFSPNMQVFRMARKAERVNLNRESANFRFVQRVMPAGRALAQCLTVEGHLYLAGRDLVVTHNCENGDGTPQTVDRILQSLDLAVQQVKSLRKAGRRMPTGAIIGLGDLVENCTGFYASQAFSIDCNRRDQNRIARELLTTAIDALSGLFDEFHLITVGGNHGENRNDGKAFTSPGDNDDLAVFEGVREAFERAGEHHSWVIPDDDLSIAVELGGVKVGATHGHLFRKGATVQAKALEFWKGQDFGMQPLRDTQILLSGHFHHASVSTYGRRTAIQAPAMDPGSRWFTQSTGEASPAGVLTLRIDAEEPLGWDDLRILSPRRDV
jgi:predicted phosphodiesterase